MRVSIVIVSYNTRDLTFGCLKSVYEETTKYSFEVLVVDNASSDGSAEGILARYPNVVLIQSETNLGFAGANNLAVKRAKGEYILLLNPDTVVLNGAIDKLVQFADGDSVFGVYGGRTVFPDRTLNASSCFAKPTLWNSYCRALGVSGFAKDSDGLSSDVYGSWLRDTVREIDIVTGCFLMMRRELWERLGGFDTSYFMYGEDWDLCLRAKGLGERCVLCPDAEIVHYGGASEPVRADKLIRLLQTRTLLYRRHWGWVYGRVLESSLWVWAIRSLIVDSLVGTLGNVGRRKSAGAWWKVLRSHREWSSLLQHPKSKE